MRPEALELEGFTAFRERTQVDFGDADLFVLSGPTGAGKSSLIDAMIFALYGRVPRLGEKLVEPVISKGRQEARIRLDFTLGGKRYTAVRVVSRTASGGGTTKEARLECGGTVLAAKAKELDEQIVALIGLSFGQFTTCVALPQGEFARFLKQTPGERQELLSQLLGLDIYKRVRDKARETRTRAEGQLASAEKSLEVLACVNKAAVKERTARLSALTKLQALAGKRLDELKGLQDHLAKAKAQHGQRETQLDALDAVRTPDAVKDLAKALAAAERRRDQAQQSLDAAERQVTRVKERHDTLGDLVALNELHAQHLTKGQLAGAVKEAKGEEESAAKAAAKQSAALEQAKSAAEGAKAALDDAQRTHAAHALRAHLTVGEPCPVCEQRVAGLPSGEQPAALGELEDALKKRRHQLALAERLNNEHGKTHSAAESLWRDRQKSYAELEKTLRDQPTLREVEQQIDAIGASTKALKAAEHEFKDAKQANCAAANALEKAQGREAKEWKGYHDQRDALLALSLAPPAPAASLRQAWADLEAWAQDLVPTLQQERATLADHADDLERKAETLDDGLAEAFAEQDVAYNDQAAINVATAAERAGFQLDQIRKQLDEKQACKKQARAARSQMNVAHALAGHLTSKGFERWLLTAAFDGLVSGASDTLRELSNGQYTFRRNDRFEFDVVDHGNAGETRSAKTLSGGETFLASLALALALSRHVADLAAEGTARLESIFLDEGFGSLDGETLDTVATAIEELSTQGRTVGIVTHVSDLAERIPVRFNVSKTAATAAVERVTR